MDGWIFSQSVVAGAINFYVCWGSSISVRAVNRINKLIRKAGTVIGDNTETFESARDKESLNKTALHQGPPTPSPPRSNTEIAELMLQQTRSVLQSQGMLLKSLLFLHNAVHHLPFVSQVNTATCTYVLL